MARGLEVPPELASRFKFARQKSKLARSMRAFDASRAAATIPVHSPTALDCAAETTSIDAFRVNP
jgi:hypothetical protein